MSAMPTRRITIEVPPELHPLAATGLLLEKLDRMPREAGAGQYRSLAQRALALLDAAEEGEALETLLDAMPALAELWENRHYATSGLCRAPLQAAMNAELEAAALLKRLRV
jgi:squalene cyclase